MQSPVRGQCDGVLDFFRRKPHDTYDYGETLHADPDYRVTFRAGEPDKAMLAFCLGNSMGGSGAILAAHLYPEVKRCLAFVPQADIRMSSPETRWKKHRKRIRRHRWPTFLLPSVGAAQRIVFGAQADQDACAQFAAAGFAVDVVDQANHRVAGHLRDSEPGRYWEMMRFVTMT